MKPWLLLFPILSVVCTHSARAEVARWADPGIPVKDGLELWLDASRENEAREAHYMNRLAEGQAMEFWHDSSGRERHLTQWSNDFRPLWRDGSAEFIGDDYLAALLTPRLESRECTVFVVAWPQDGGDEFPGMFSAARRDENDYTSGLTIDFGRTSTRDGQAKSLNVEGAGQSGEGNLLTQPVTTNRGHLITIASSAEGSVARVDGSPQGRRDRGKVAFAMDRVAVGARFVEPTMSHFFRGRIAEVVFFNRKLDAGEIAKVEQWLSAKHAAFLRVPDPNRVQLLPAKDPPIVQMLVPGFRVDELKVETTNLNNIEYAPDGRLFAGGYDGRFHLLRDTDGDGIEDKLDTFSGETSDNYPLGMVVKDGMPHAVLSDEIVRFRDTNNDGVPDRRETVVKGWDDPKLRDDPGLMHRRADSAMALAMGPNGSWYVTMGSANPGNGYWQKMEGDHFAINAVKTGKPAYSPVKRRGCLLRISPDGKVEKLNSGLRYIMSLQWDRHGELFATDQEGATWLPNGNPFDELLHLQTGRHYGFPPRHPELLPNVIDEPSVWDYSPQHQSTCGFRFNGPAQDRPRFGPEFWAYDAIVTGESRGKLWRTSLAKTAAGYVANNRLFAAVGMLITDCAISPQGDLVICCHSGPPDWGKGPSGIGRLFKIRYIDHGAPQPVLTWAADETKTVIGFDRPLDASAWKDLASRIHVEGGPHVAAADRFEAIRPGYAVVRNQQSEPRFRIPVKSAALGEDRRSIVVETDPRTQAASYAITLDVPRTEPGIKQADTLDVALDLTGLATEWRGDDGSSWSGWFPHPDFAVVREFTRGSAVHKKALSLLAKPGKLLFRTKLDLSNMLQPATQPGSKIDYKPGPEIVTIGVNCDAPVRLKLEGKPIDGTSFTRTITGNNWLDLELQVATPATRLEITFHTAIDPRPRPLGVRRFLMPFVTPPNKATGQATIVEIAGGNWDNGRKLYHGKATCFTCHTIHGEGHAVGPDLSNTAHRDYASVLRDINEPSASINPDAVAYQVTLKDGTTALGTRVGETDSELKLASPGGTVTTLRKADIATTSALPVSLMPPGLLAALNAQEVKDLMTFLLTAPQRDE
ncbi:MAG: c-type cytochrome [Verrucomicrobiota bacterium]